LAIEDRRGRTAGRAAGGPVHVERVADGPERGVFAGRAEGELVQVGLAEKDGAGRAQPFDDARVVGGDVSVTDPRGGGRRHAADVDQVLERNRYAMQRATGVALPDLGVSLPGLVERLLLERGDVGVDRRVAFGDAVETTPGGFFRGDLSRRQGAGEIRQ